MATSDINLADRSGSLVESHRSYQPRVIFFYFVVALLLLVLVGGLAYQQVIKGDIHHERERMQSQRRIVVPGPRGDIVDREGRVLVGNQQRLSIVLYLDELQVELRREYIRVRKNYRETGDKDLPSSEEMAQIARVSVAQHYLDQVNAIIGRDEKIDNRDFDSAHFSNQLLLPYVLIDDLAPEEFARLVEHLPVNSPLQVYTASKRVYPYDSAAAHVIGMVKPDTSVEVEDLGGDDLKTFRMKGTVGRDGLEKEYDTLLQGEAGGAIFQVDRMGYKVKPLQQRTPRQGKKLVTSLDIDLQLAAEASFAKYAEDKAGAVVALDVRTGEVLALASAPNYNLNEVSPRISTEKYAEIEEQGGWSNRATQGLYPPGSTFKILVSIAGMRAGTIDPDDTSIVCNGTVMVGNKRLLEENGTVQHGPIALREAIAESCDVYFWTQGLKTGVDVIATEARRFHLDQRTEIQLPETRGIVIPDPAWKERVLKEKWFPGDTANMSIGQGYVLVTPLDMACFAASVARGELTTKPTMLHDPQAPAQHSEPIGLTSAQRAVLLGGMEDCTISGTANYLTQYKDLRIPGLRIAGKTGTAQVSGKKNVAWFICFAPLEHPEIALAVAMEGDTAGETVGGGRYAAPIAQGVLKKWWEKKNAPTSPGISIKGPN